MEPLQQLIDQAGLEKIFLLLLAPVFATLMVTEALHLQRRGRQTYSWRRTINNIVLALTHSVADAVAWSVVIGLFVLAHRHALFDLPHAWWTGLLLFVGQDFLYYWFHRGSHRIRWMWASHVTHHSSEHMNLSTALRQSVTYPLSGMWAFWLPLAFLGFAPEQVVLIVAINLGYQFFVHTEVVRKLPPIVELIFNTPSHHRVHHSRNAQYIDKNYAGVLVIWDRLFGTYAEEIEACEYGITRQVRTDNPLTMMFHEWRDMFADAAQRGPLALRVKHLWAPPEWQRTRQ
jgi:sterol desaturase/sphingolipid hydroxylase (fatty acid hydroxylase superfamily)